MLKPNSHRGQQDQQEQDARISCGHSRGSKSCRETWSNNVDYRIPGIPLSAVEQQDTNRKDEVKKLIQQFENHPNKESFLQDLKQTEKINKFSEKSQELIAVMHNTEIFELCETSSKRQCSNCNFSGRSALFIAMVEDVQNRRKELRSTTRTTTTSYQFLVVLLERITLAVPNMDLLKDNECISRLRKCCKKLVNPSMKDINPYMRGGTKTINVEILCHSSGGPRRKLLNMTPLPWRIIHTSQQDLREFEIQNTGYSDWITTVLNNRLINDLILLKQKENADEFQDSTRIYRTIPRDQQVRH